MGDFMSLVDVSRRLEVSEKTVRRLVKSGDLPAMLIGQQYRIDSDDLQKFLERSRVTKKSSRAAPSRSEALEPILAGNLTPEEMQEHVAALDITDARALLNELKAEQDRLLPLLPQPNATWTTQDRENFHRFTWINRGMAVVLNRLASEIEALA